jgi:hypothetical protein
VEIKAIRHAVSASNAMIQRGQSEPVLTEFQNADVRVKDFRNMTSLRVGT